MNILKEVLKHEVFPALGCTEPIAVAYTASIAAKEAEEEIEEISITVDPGVYKNGLAVMIPNSGGDKGNLIAGVLGALVKRPELKMEILSGIKDDMKARAENLIQSKKAVINFDDSKTSLFIEVSVKTRNNSARALVAGSHTNIIRIEKNDTIVYEKDFSVNKSEDFPYKSIMKNKSLSELTDMVDSMDESDFSYIKQGIEMNLIISEEGKKLKNVGYYLQDLVKKGYMSNDIFSSSKIMTASASDARMAGMNFPVMSSGGSGNQGIVAVLVPYNVGKYFGIEEKTILKSIALSHLINSYIKCYTGDLCPLCGCSIAAGVGASVAIVYQTNGKDMGKITMAVNNLISDLGGMLCDGAKPGCALKVVSSTDSAIRSAYMAMNDHGITSVEGFIGRTAEETIFNLSRISEIGMDMVDDTILRIMKEKN